MPKICSRSGCAGVAVAQLSHLYADLVVEVLTVDDPDSVGACLLCAAHLERLKVPKGWRLIRRGAAGPSQPSPSDLEKLAAEIRRVGGVGAPSQEQDGTEHSLSSRTNLVTLTSRAHLRVVADAARYETS